MNTKCRDCGKETEADEIYCPQCADSLGAVKRKKIWLFAGIFSALLLILTGMLLWSGNCCNLDLSWGDLTGKPVALINGEAISRADLRDRMKVSRRMMEQQYGEDLFRGGAGNARLALLRNEVLNRMMEERIIAQEARRMGIEMTDAVIEKEMRRIAEEIYGSWENFQKRTREDGITPAVLKNHIRQIMTVQQVMKAKAVTAAAGAPSEDYFNSWLFQEKKAAKVVVYDSSVNTTGLRLRLPYPGGP